jgi:hypothetical protein
MDSGSIPNGGKKAVEHYRSIARKLFIDDPQFKWSEADLKQLGESIKNRITAYVPTLPYSLLYSPIHSMKKAYVKQRSKMSETGQGLLDNGNEADILEGSEIANVWGEHAHLQSLSFSDLKLCQTKSRRLSLGICGCMHLWEQVLLSAKWQSHTARVQLILVCWIVVADR